jgi:hypothetical protein
MPPRKPSPSLARLTVLTDFPGAAAEKVAVADSGNRVSFAAPLGGSPRGMWFHFKTVGGDGSVVTFVLTNREQMLGRRDYHRAVPVYRRDDGDWQRVNPIDCFTDEANHAAAEPGWAAGAAGAAAAGPPLCPPGSFVFRVPCGPGVTEIAYCYPYTLDMLDAAFARWQAGRDVTILTLCRTQHRRPVRVVRIGKPARGRKVVWVLARQHSGETPGGFAAEGFVDAVLSSAAWAKQLRRRAVVFVCPAVDVDGVAEGLYGKDRGPVDFNRDWSANPARREIAALRNAMDSSRRACGGSAANAEKIAAVVDLHAPGPGAVSFPVPPHPAWAGRAAWQRAWRLARAIERFAGYRTPVRWANGYADHIDWSPPALSCRTASAFHVASGLADFSMSLELSYHWQVTGALAKPADWRRIGQSLARAIEATACKDPPAARPDAPDPPFYLSESHGWLNVPRQCTAHVNGDRISVQAEGPQGYAAILFAEPIPVKRGRFLATSSLGRTTRGRSPMHRLVFFFRDGVFTGEMFEQAGDLAGQDEIAWHGPVSRKFPADTARVAVVLRNWVGTITLAGPKAE